MFSKAEIITMINNDDLPLIRSGETHPFTEVWMVTMDDRIFVRSAKMVPGDSWYDAFLRNPDGAIKVNGHIIPVTTKIPDDLDTLTEDVNNAYKKKYGGKHPVLVKGIYRDFIVRNTMEFIIK